MANATNEASLPWQIDIDPFGTPKSVVGTWENLVATDRIFNAIRRNNPRVQNDEIAFDVLLSKGTWTIELMGRIDESMAIQTIRLDGTSVGTIDWYEGVSGASNTLKSITGISVSVTKTYELKIQSATKNASSSGYDQQIQAIRWLRTA